MNTFGHVTKNLAPAPRPAAPATLEGPSQMCWAQSGASKTYHPLLFLEYTRACGIAVCWCGCDVPSGCIRATDQRQPRCACFLSRQCVAVLGAGTLLSAVHHMCASISMRPDNWPMIHPSRGKPGAPFSCF